MGSPSEVPVPWHSTTSTSAGARRASSSAARRTFCCEVPLGAVMPLVAPSWLTALPRTTARTWRPWARASLRRSRASDDDALAAAVTVGVRREGLGATVGGERAGAREKRGSDSGATMTWTPAARARSHSPLAQRLAGQVKRHQRGGAGGVDRERGPLQAEGEGEATGGERGVPFPVMA